MAKLERMSDGFLAFYCPGCRMHHGFDSSWTFDGNMEAPTFSPSLKYGPNWQMPPGWDPDKAPRNEDGTYKVRPDGKMIEAVLYCCHIFVRSGMIEFLSDCTHELAGKTVPMVDLDA